MMSQKLSAVSPHHNFDYDSSCCRDRVLAGGQGEASHPSSPMRTLPAEVLVGEGRSEADGGDETAVAEMDAEVEQEVERVARLPTYQPTKSDYDEHAVTHCPYRPWCPDCAEGRGQEFGHHRRREKDVNRVPLVSFDYAGLSDKGEVVRLEFAPEDESATKVLVVSVRTMGDMQTAVFGHVVPRKGVDENQFAVDCLVEDILWTG